MSDVTRLPDGSGLVRQHFSDTVKVYAAGEAKKIKKTLEDNLDIENRYWKLTVMEVRMIVESDNQLADVTFLAHQKTKKFNQEKLTKLLEKYKLKFKSIDVKHNYHEAVISPWLMDRIENE